MSSSPPAPLSEDQKARMRTLLDRLPPQASRPVFILNEPVPVAPPRDLAMHAAMLDSIRDEFPRLTRLFWQKVGLPPADKQAAQCWYWNGSGEDFSFRLKGWDNPIRWNPARFAHFVLTDKDLADRVVMMCAQKNRDRSERKCANPNHIKSLKTHEGI